jgi:hypothetical protein
MARLAGAATFAALALCGSGGARADEVALGAYAHDVDTFISSHAREAGADIEVAYRTSPIEGLRAIGRPMIVLELFGNTAGRTSFGSLSFTWRRYWLHERLYGQIGFGMAIHDHFDEIPDPYAPGLPPAEAQHRLAIAQNFKALGTRVLFDDQLALGWRLTPRFAIEASWVHISNAGLGHSNPGLDDFGGRLVWRFGPRRR